MATRYCGPGGNDANDGLSYANRKLTLNGLEDSPVQAGDVCYIAPGTYRETLTVDVSGSAGSPITYIGDYTGANTDGTGGVVRITGSDNDQTAARQYGINCTAQRNYRTFRGFALDMYTGYYVTGGLATSGTNWIVEQCYFGISDAAAAYSIVCGGANQAAWTVRNCYFMTGRSALSVWFYHNADVSDCGHVVENCIAIGTGSTIGAAIMSSSVGGITVRNCNLYAFGYGVQVAAALAAGQTVTVNNCTFQAMNVALVATTLGEIVENYNAFTSVSAARSNVAVGANSNTYPPLFDTRWFFEMVNGGDMVTPFDLASYSQLVNVAGTSPTTTDMRGTSVIGAQREWGALEFDPDLDIEAGSCGGGAVSISPWRGNIG